MEPRRHFQGVHDSPLTAMGREQVTHRGKILDRMISDWSTVDIYSSPQGRAKTTAEIALDGNEPNRRFA